MRAPLVRNLGVISGKDMTTPPKTYRVAVRSYVLGPVGLLGIAAISALWLQPSWVIAIAWVAATSFWIWWISGFKVQLEREGLTLVTRFGTRHVLYGDLRNARIVMSGRRPWGLSLFLPDRRMALVIRLARFSKDDATQIADAVMRSYPVGPPKGS